MLLMWPIRKLWPLLLVVIPLWTHAQVKHAPSIEQCRADQRLWQSKLNAVESFTEVGAKELVGWGTEMGECLEVDPSPIFQKAYADTRADTTAVQAIRMFHFIDRHNLFEQYLAEDAQGKR